MFVFRWFPTKNIPIEGQAGAWRSQKERQAPAWLGDCSWFSWTIYFSFGGFNIGNRLNTQIESGPLAMAMSLRQLYQNPAESGYFVLHWWVGMAYSQNGKGNRHGFLFLSLEAIVSPAILIMSQRVEKWTVIPSGTTESSVQGWQTMVYVVGLIKDLCNRQVTVHGTGFWHPCQNDGIFAKMRIAVVSWIVARFLNMLLWDR